MLEQLLVNPFLYSVSLTLLHFLWQGLLVAAVLKSALLIINKSKSRLRYALSCIAMLVNLLIAISTFLYIFPSNTALAANNITLTHSTSLVTELIQQNNLVTYQELFPSILTYSLPYIALLWFISITVLACKLLVEVNNVNHLSKYNNLLPSNELLTRFNALAKQIKLTKTPKLLISLKIDVPMAIGWLKPVVLLPASMVTGLNSAQLEMLLLHELAHIRRYDYAVNFLQTLVELLFFFHPSVAWVAKQIRNEREYCSDDIAVQYCGDPIAYAHTLADTASLCAKRHLHTIPSMAMAASGGDLKERVLRLVDHHCAPSNNISKWFAAMSIMLSITLIFSNQLIDNQLVSSSLSNQWQKNNQFSSTDHDDTLKYRFSPNHHTNKKQIKSNYITKETQQIKNIDSIAKQLLKKEKSTKQLTVSSVIAKTNEITTNQVKKIVPLKRHANNNDIQITSVEKKQTVKKVKIKTNTLEKTLTASTVEQKQQLNTNQVKIPKSHLTLIAEDTTKNSINTVELNSITLPRKFKASAEINSSIARAEKAIQTFKNTAENDSVVALSFQRTDPNHQSPNQQQLLILEAGNKQYLTITELDDIQASTTKSNSFKNTPVWHDAKQLNSVDPVYPKLAKRKGIEIDVKVHFTIDEYGQVKDIKFAQKSRINYFKSSIRAAIRKWRFLPAKRNEKAVESQMSKIFSFSLQT